MSRKLIHLTLFGVLTGLILSGPALAADPNLMGYWKLDGNATDSAGTADGTEEGGATYTTLGQPVWNLADDRVSVAGPLVLTNKGYMTRKGEKRDRFPAPEGREGSDPPVSEEQHLLKCSAVNALSWGYFNAKELPPKVEAVD